MLTFTFEKDRSEVDFLIEYDNPKNWNDAGYFIIYTIKALPRLTGGEAVSLGHFYIFSPEQEIKEVDALSRIMNKAPVFASLKESFCSLMLSEEGAQRLFILLNPEQRKEFCSALNLCLDIDTCKILSKNQLYFRTVLRYVYDNRYEIEYDIHGFSKAIIQENKAWEAFEKKYLFPIRKYLYNDLSIEDLRGILGQDLNI